MTTLSERACAKLNLTLDVLSKRPDGYHDLRSVMQTVSLCDDVEMDLGIEEESSLHCFRELRRINDEGETEILLDTDGLPQDDENLAWKAVSAFYDRTGIPAENFELFISKRIPSGAGLGGGSADAAAVLRMLNRHYGSPLSVAELCALGAEIGSDVPFCVLGGTALAEGRGEQLTPLNAVKGLCFVICKPEVSLSTAELYHRLDDCAIASRPDHAWLLDALDRQDLPSAGSCLCNVFTHVASKNHPEITEIIDKLLACGACGAEMTGSGSAVFGLFPGREQADAACETLKKTYSQVWTAVSV